MFPQTLINVRLQPDQDWRANPRLQAVQREVSTELGDRGRLLIRASGTEPLLRVMVEAEQADLARESAQRLVEAIQPA